MDRLENKGIYTQTDDYGLVDNFLLSGVEIQINRGGNVTLT